MNRDASSNYLAPGVHSLGWGPQGIGIGYPVGAAILTGLLGLTFLIWKVSGLTFKIDKINTLRGEALFWTAILISNTLGTSLGDYLSDSSRLGYAGAAELILAVLAVLLALRYVPRVSNVALFWAAFVLTRPLGATVGDFFTKPTSKGGLDLGTYGATAVLATVFFSLMGYMALKERQKADDRMLVTQPA